MQHDNVRSGIPHSSGSNSEPISSQLVNSGESVQEVLVDLCDICSYFEKQKQRVKWCKTSEGHDLLLCKPCFISMEKITLEGNDG